MPWCLTFPCWIGLLELYVSEWAGEGLLWAHISESGTEALRCVNLAIERESC